MSRWNNLARLSRTNLIVLSVILIALLAAGARKFLGPRALPAATAMTLAIGPVASPNSAAPSSAIAGDGALQEWLRQPVEPLSRNVFSIDPAGFAPAAPNGTERPQLPGVLPGTEAKSASRQADGKRGEMVRIEDLRLQASGIRLQSTLMGAMPSALVNGRTVREGDVVASFRVLRIEARRIILEREGIKLEVPLK